MDVHCCRMLVGAGLAGVGVVVVVVVCCSMSVSAVSAIVSGVSVESVDSDGCWKRLEKIRIMQDQNHDSSEVWAGVTVAVPTGLQVVKLLQI